MREGHSCLNSHSLEAGDLEGSETVRQCVLGVLEDTYVLDDQFAQLRAGRCGKQFAAEEGCSLQLHAPHGQSAVFYAFRCKVCCCCSSWQGE